MKLALNFFLILFALLTFNDKSFSLTNDQIIKFCKREKRTVFCIKNLKEKNNKLQNGRPIEIPVIPYKK